MSDRPRRRLLKDGRLSGTLTRRLLDTAVRYPGRLITMDQLAAGVWPQGRPKTWRVCLPHQAQQLNARLGAEVLTRIGNACRIEGYRLNPKVLPQRNVSAMRSKPMTRWPWTLNEDTIIRENVPGLTLSRLTALVNAAHGHQHTEMSVEMRIYILGLSKKNGSTYSANSLGPVLGVDGVKITRWIERGLLAAQRTEPWRNPPLNKRNSWWSIRHKDVEAFIRAYPWEVDWRAMKPGHQLTLLARSIDRRDPYLTVAQAARRVGCTETALWQRLVAGKVQGYVRVTPFSPKSSPERATIRIPLSALADMPAKLPRGPRPGSLAQGVPS